MFINPSTILIQRASTLKLKLFSRVAIVSKLIIPLNDLSRAKRKTDTGTRMRGWTLESWKKRTPNDYKDSCREKEPCLKITI